MKLYFWKFNFETLCVDVFYLSDYSIMKINFNNIFVMIKFQIISSIGPVCEDTQTAAKELSNDVVFGYLRWNSYGVCWNNYS